VLIAAGISYALASGWPDIIVGVIIANLFLNSAYSVLRESVQSLNAKAEPLIANETIAAVELRRK